MKLKRGQMTSECRETGKVSWMAVVTLGEVLSLNMETTSLVIKEQCCKWSCRGESTLLGGNISRDFCTQDLKYRPQTAITSHHGIFSSPVRNAKRSAFDWQHPEFPCGLFTIRQPFAPKHPTTYCVNESTIWLLWNLLKWLKTQIQKPSCNGLLLLSQYGTE